jgi:hypothetical protein
MTRRQFVASTAASSALAVALRSASASHASAAAAPDAAPMDTKPRGHFLLRRYTLRTGPQTALTERFFADALLPALNRLGFTPVGAFKLDIGPETPTFYLLIPGASVEALATLDLHLAEDAAFLAAAEPFWSAPAAAPAFLRVESSLHVAFTGWPRLTSPASAAAHTMRIFQLRTYESPSFHDHALKVEMFHSGEFDFFRNAGFHPVFFGDTLIGPRQPSLTYMLSFADLNELTAQWKVFSADPAWKKLSTSSRFGSEAIVSNITNLILSPLACSQI